jgi:hypothetical protein
MSWGDDPRTGVPWFSNHPSSNARGYWMKGEKRPGTSKDDPKRYRRHSLDELQKLGFAVGDISYEEALAPFQAEYDINVRERGELGGKAVAKYEHPFRKHTQLGRMREAKQYGYVMRREEIRQQLEAAGLDANAVEDVLDSWDNEEDLRVEVTPGTHGRSYALYSGAGKLIGDEFTDDDLTWAAVQGTEMEGEYLDFLDDQRAREEAAALYLGELQAQGMDPYALGHAYDDFVDHLDEVRDAIEHSRALVPLDGETDEELYLEDPHNVDLRDLPF